MRRFLFISSLCLVVSAFTVTAPPTHAPSFAETHEVHVHPQDQTVYVTKTGKKYHRGNCRYLSKSKIPMKLSDARRKYGACSVCKPPRVQDLGSIDLDYSSYGVGEVATASDVLRRTA